MPRQDLFASFSVARALQHDVRKKTDQIGILKGKLEWSEQTRIDMEKEILKILNTFDIVFSGSIMDLKKHLSDIEMTDNSTLPELVSYPLKYQNMSENNMGFKLLSEVVGIEFNHEVSLL